MIQELKIKNYLSFRDEVTFSFDATKDTTFEPYQVVEIAPNVRLLRFALVYGANASGKSNLLEALSFLHDFWFEKRQDIDEPTGVIPFLLDKETIDEPTEFQLRFYVGKVRYWYIAKLDRTKVYNEKLYFYTSNQPTLIFNRELKQEQSFIKFNPAVVKLSPTALEALTLKCLPNMSVFAARNQLNITIPKMDEARDWMRNKVLPVIDPQTNMFEYAGKKMHENEALKKYILDFVHRADFNITDVQTDKVSRQLPSAFVSAMMEDENIPAEEKEQLKYNSTFDSIRTTFLHTVRNKRGVETYMLPNHLQSAGTRRAFGIEAAIYEALQGQAFLAIDEIESSLHPDLVEFILEKFFKEQNQSQLVITSHYDPLLNTVDDLLRKDCIWFTEKDESGASTLYSLVEFKGLGKIKSFQKSYRNGIFGAIPSIK